MDETDERSDAMRQVQWHRNHCTYGPNCDSCALSDEEAIEAVLARWKEMRNQ
jgi:hypothetical protein